MRYAISNKFEDNQIIKNAQNGFMHFSQCINDGSDTDRSFFKTREEAEADAESKTGYWNTQTGKYQPHDSADCVMLDYEARSCLYDKDGDLCIEDIEDCYEEFLENVELTTNYQ